jgi:hypothetical protein
VRTDIVRAMQVCQHCGAKNIDNLKSCWSCRQPLGVTPSELLASGAVPPVWRARGIRPIVGVPLLLIIAGAIGAWWYLRAPDPVLLPSHFAGAPAILVEESREQERRVADRLDIATGYAFYGPSSDSLRYSIVVFRELRPPYTPAFLVNDYQRYIQQQLPFVESEQLLERRDGEVRYTCHRVPEPDGMLGEAGLGKPYLWCTWQVADEELGILLDLTNQRVGRTLSLTRDAREAVASM